MKIGVMMNNVMQVLILVKGNKMLGFALLTANLHLNVGWR